MGDARQVTPAYGLAAPTTETDSVAGADYFEPVVTDGSRARGSETLLREDFQRVATPSVD
ncbi:MAG: hypothetical protein WA829_05785 [Candidatus Acidiferrum sp.]